MHWYFIFYSLFFFETTLGICGFSDAKTWIRKKFYFNLLNTFSFHLRASQKFKFCLISELLKTFWKKPLYLLRKKPKGNKWKIKANKVSLLSFFVSFVNLASVCLFCLQQKWKKTQITNLSSNCFEVIELIFLIIFENSMNSL